MMLHKLYEMICTPLHVHFRWGVTLVGKLSTRHCSPYVGNYFSGTQGEVTGLGA